MKIAKNDIIGWKCEVSGKTLFALLVLSDPDPKSKEFEGMHLTGTNVGIIESDWYVGSYSDSTNWVKMKLEQDNG